MFIFIESAVVIVYSWGVLLLGSFIIVFLLFLVLGLMLRKNGFKGRGWDD